MLTEALATIHVNKQQQRSHHNNNKTNNNNNMLKSSNSAVNMFNNNNNNNNIKQDLLKRGGSFVMGQKLRESKWFKHEEIGIFCAVVESGFIVERKNDPTNVYGIVIWTPGYEKSKNSDYLTIYTITEIKCKFKVQGWKLLEFWPHGTSLRINNKSDKNVAPLPQNVIRNQISNAQYCRKTWHNTEHFVYFCRYGPVEVYTLRKITDQLRCNAENLFLKMKSFSTSK